MTEKINLLNLDREALAVFFAGHGEQRFRADQLSQWIHQFGVIDFDKMTNMSKPLRSRLKGCAEIRFPEMVREELSKDGTRKWLFRLDDGNVIETVFIPEGVRGTLCISSQAGCILDCTFCATARQGFSRNLTTAEIVAQLWMANRFLAGFGRRVRVVSNVVMMGMGEPLYNYRNVLPALRVFMDDFAYGLSSRRVTLSTAGVVPHILKLVDDCDISLAISLHASNDELRNKLVPINRRFPLAELLAACKKYTYAKARRVVTMEYVMLDGMNDQPQHAKELSRLLEGLPVKINLIPFNPFKGISYRCSDSHTIRRFRAMLKAAGLVATIRKTRGQDIEAACGQLAGEVRNRSMRFNEVQVAVS